MIRIASVVFLCCLSGLVACSADVNLDPSPATMDDDGSAQGGSGGDDSSANTVGSGGVGGTGGSGGFLEEEAPTWGQCRTLHQTDALSDEDRELCDAYHRTSPDTMTFGVRWVVLDDTNPDMKNEVERHLVMVNKLYGALGLSFETSAYMLHANPTLDLFDNDKKKVTLRDLSSDIAAYLELSSTTPEEILDDLKARLEQMGASQMQADKLDLDAEITSQVYWQIIARAFGEEIVVYVGRPSTIQGRRGVSSPPRRGHDTNTASCVFLSYAGMANMHGTLAHELGHYFGLFHTHQGDTLKDGEVEVKMNNLGGVYKNAFGSTEGFTEAFWKLVDTKGSVADNFLAYDASDEAIKQADMQRIATSAYLPAWGFTYQDDLVPFDTVSTFVDTIDDPQLQVFLKNFKNGGKPDNNCASAKQNTEIKCTFKPVANSNDPTVLEGDDTFLTDTITSADGTKVNLMSYIRPGKTSHDESRQMLSDSQLEAVRLGTVSPPRLNLRNRELSP